MGDRDRDGLRHLDPCVCTRDRRTGAVVDYDCGRALSAAGFEPPVFGARAGGSPYGSGDDTGWMGQVGMYAELGTHVPPPREVSRLSEGFGVGQVVPDAFTAAVERQFRAEAARREAELRAELTDRVHDAITRSQSARGLFMGPDGRTDAEAAVQAFTEWVREGRVES